MATSYVITGNTLTVRHDGQTITIRPDHDHYMEALKAVHTNKLDDLPRILNLGVRLETKTKGLVEVKDNVVTLGGQEMPDALVKELKKLIASNIPHAWLMRFWERCQKNPDPVARRDLFSFIRHNGHPLTQDGRFLAYKRVTEDRLDFHTGKVLYKDKTYVEMDRKLVNSNPNETCSSGLHVASHRYAQDTYANKGGPMIECLVDPQDVCAVPTDYGREKMRLCRLWVMGASNGKRTTDSIVLDAAEIDLPEVRKAKAKRGPIKKTKTDCYANGKKKKLTYYKLVGKKLLTIRKVVCPPGFSKVKPVIKKKR